MAQQKQHKVIQMDIRLKLMKHYKEDQPPETGLQIHYDIKKLREDPQKAERWLTQRNAPPEIAPETTAEEDWEKIKKPIQHTLQKIYPKDNKQKGKQIPEWAKKAKQWSTEKEWEEMQQRLNKRNELQQQITKIDQTILKQQKQIELMRILEAWKQATIYLKKNKASIKYSNIPEPETTRTQKKGKNK